VGGKYGRERHALIITIEGYFGRPYSIAEVIYTCRPDCCSLTSSSSRGAESSKAPNILAYPPGGAFFASALTPKTTLPPHVDTCGLFLGWSAQVPNAGGF